MAATRAAGPSPLHAVLVGATGAIGQHVLRAVLQDPRFARVTTIGRRSVDLDAVELPPEADAAKLSQFEVNMDDLAADDVWDSKVAAAAATQGGGEAMRAVCFCTLGTTRGKAGGSAQGFRKVDFEYVQAAAVGARRVDARHI